jgi:predicted aspartyl protease
MSAGPSCCYHPGGVRAGGKCMDGLPRRQVLGYGLASLAFAKTAFAENAAFEPLPAQIKVTPKQLTIAVRINGKGPYRFVVDTGADRSLMAAELAEELHLPLGRQVTVQGIIRAVPAQSVPVARLRFGAAIRDNLELPVLPRQMLQADGYLGLDAIGRRRVVFDFKRQTMAVVESRPVYFVDKSGSNSETRLAAPGEGGHLKALACVVDGVSAAAFIDSGAEVSVGNKALQQALLKFDPGYAGSRDIELTGVTGGSCSGRVLKVETILLGNLEFSGCELAIADLDVFRIWDLADKPALLIGLNFLRQFATVSVDYGRKEYRLNLTSNTGWVNRKRA